MRPCAHASIQPCHAPPPPSDYLIGKVEGAEPPFKPGGLKPEGGGEPVAAAAPEAAGQEGAGDEPALQKGKVLKVSTIGRRAPAGWCRGAGVSTIGEGLDGKEVRLRGACFVRTAMSTQARLTEKEEITHDTRRFRFALPREVSRLGLWCCQGSAQH